MNKLLMMVAALTLAADPALAQSWPTQPVKLIVGYPAGGASDVAARLIAKKVGDNLGQTIVVENKAGAASNIGADFVAKSAPDGYTFLLGTIALSINPSLYTKLTYDSLKDLTAVAMIGQTPFVLVSNPKSPYTSVKKLIGAAREENGQINYATAGNGSGSHLFMELFSSLAGVKLTHVPYRGAAPAINDVLANTVPVTFDNIITTLPLVRSGRLTALAVSTAQRSKVAPDIPTLAESGVPAFDATAWFGVLAPVGTPREIVLRMNREINDALKDPDVNARLLKLGAEPIQMTPEQFDAFYRAEVAKWAKVVREANVKID